VGWSDWLIMLQQFFTQACTLGQRPMTLFGRTQCLITQWKTGSTGLVTLHMNIAAGASVRHVQPPGGVLWPHEVFFNQLNRGTRRAVGGGPPPYKATRPRFFSASFALPRPAVPQLRPAGARGMWGVRLVLSFQKAWY
jgi:hypothetical protein